MMLAKLKQWDSGLHIVCVTIVYALILYQCTSISISIFCLCSVSKSASPFTPSKGSHHSQPPQPVLSSITWVAVQCLTRQKVKEQTYLGQQNHQGCRGPPMGRRSAVWSAPSQGMLRGWGGLLVLSSTCRGPVRSHTPGRSSTRSAQIMPFSTRLLLCTVPQTQPGMWSRTSRIMGHRLWSPNPLLTWAPASLEEPMWGQTGTVTWWRCPLVTWSLFWPGRSIPQTSMLCSLEKQEQVRNI